MEIFILVLLLLQSLFMFVIFVVMGLPGSGYLFGFKKAKIKYRGQTVNLFYKLVSSVGEFGVGGSRSLNRAYIVKDDATRWSGFYVKLILDNNISDRTDTYLSAVEIHGFKEIDLWSFLQKLILLPDFEIDQSDYNRDQETLKRRFKPILSKLFMKEMEESIESLSKSLKRKRAFSWLEKLIGR